MIMQQAITGRNAYQIRYLTLCISALPPHPYGPPNFASVLFLALLGSSSVVFFFSFFLRMMFFFFFFSVNYHPFESDIPCQSQEAMQLSNKGSPMRSPRAFKKNFFFRSIYLLPLAW